MRSAIPHHEGRNRRKWLIAILAFAVAFLLFGGAVGSFFVPVAPTTFKRVDRGNETREFRSADQQRKGEPSTAAQLDEGQSAPRLPAAAPDAAETDGTNESATITIRFVTLKGKPVAGVLVECIVTSTNPFAGRNHTRVSSITAQSNMSGEVTVTSSVDHWVQLEIRSTDWFGHPPNAVSFAGDAIVEVVLSPVSTVRIRALYDDGKPLTTRGQFIRPSVRGVTSPAGGGTWPFKLLRDGTASVRVAVDEPLRCRVTARERPGYFDHDEVFSISELMSGQELQIIVKRASSPFGGVRIEFPDGPLGARAVLQVEGSWGPPRAQEKQLAPSQAVIEVWPLAPGDYRFTVTSASASSGQHGRAWRSGWVSVVRDRTTTIAARLDEGAKVTARLVDSLGNPIEGGSLRLSNGDYLPFRISGYTKRHSPVGNPESNRDGKVALTGIPAGAVDIEAEAWGKEPQVRAVQLAAGQVIDLGTIVLPDALGEITVEVINMRHGFTYSAFIGSHRVTSSIYPWQKVRDGKCVFRNLAVRPYHVTVTFERGGRLVSKLVELTSDHPIATVVLDVSDLEPRKHPTD